MIVRSSQNNALGSRIAQCQHYCFIVRTVTEPFIDLPASVLIQVLTRDIILGYLVNVDILSLIVFRIFNTSEHIGFKCIPFFDQLKEVLGIKMFDSGSPCKSPDSSPE